MAERICAIDGCGGKVIARGWCSPHYFRWRDHGDPLGGSTRRRATLTERLWAKVTKDGPTPTHRPDLGPCWVWHGALTKGYGTIRQGAAGSPMLQAHRVAYEDLVGPIPDGLELDHLCRNPPCVNPAHLDPVTHEVNMARGLRDRQLAAL